jgi:putative oxidoreductase
MQFLNKLQAIALTLLRIAAGAIFFSHGWMKLMHPSATMKMFAGMGFPAWVGVAIGALETAGGILLLLGLFTRIFALLLFVEMCVAIIFVHWRHAAWWNVGTYELPLAVAAISLALAAFGPGVASIDHALGRNRGR